jgi:hypothetical protein
MDTQALAKFIDAFRASIDSWAQIPGDGDRRSEVDWDTLISLGLLQLKPAAFETPEEDLLPPEQQTEKQTLRPYPSVRRIALHNVSDLIPSCSCILASCAMSSLQSVR